MKKPTLTKPEYPISEAMHLLGVTTRQGVIYMITAGQLPGAHKLTSGVTAWWMIPRAAIENHRNYKREEN